tara:strand:+ start:1617 stop:1952 length:336 start_codon:yes stop_codon:yes gene_type:complete
MGIKTIILICGLLHIVLGIGRQIIGSDIADGLDIASMMLVGSGLFLVVLSRVKDLVSGKLILGAETVFLLWMLGIALVNIALAGFPPPPVWAFIIINLLLCGYGLLRVERV